MEESVSCLRLVFTGDISFSGYYDGLEKDDILCNEVREYVKGADSVIGNVECALTNHVINSNRALNHASPIGAGLFLANNNIKIWNLANNHVFDCGLDGLNDTIATAKSNGCITIGAGNSLEEASEGTIIGEHVKVGVLSIAKPWKHIKSGPDKPGCFTWDEEAELKRRINLFRSEVDWLVLIAHGEEEFNDLPFPYTRKRYKKYLEWGVDIIVAHHPHVVQNYETVGEKVIFYSLGNFIFDTDNQREYDHTNTGMLIGICFTKQDFTYDSFSITINRDDNKIEKGNIPAIFSNINAKDYYLLWALAAKEYYKIYKRKKMKFNNSLKEMSDLRFLLHEIRACKNKKERSIYIGMMVSLLRIWNFSRRDDIKKYLLNERN